MTVHYGTLPETRETFILEAKIGSFVKDRGIDIKVERYLKETEHAGNVCLLSHRAAGYDFILTVSTMER